MGNIANPSKIVKYTVYQSSNFAILQQNEDITHFPITLPFAIHIISYTMFFIPRQFKNLIFKNFSTKCPFSLTHVDQD